MLSWVVCRCLFWLMRRYFLGRWICLLVSERLRLVWQCCPFGCNTYIQFCVHWHGDSSSNSAKKKFWRRPLGQELLYSTRRSKLYSAGRNLLSPPFETWPAFFIYHWGDRILWNLLDNSTTFEKQEVHVFPQVASCLVRATGSFSLSIKTSANMIWPRCGTLISSLIDLVGGWEMIKEFDLYPNRFNQNSQEKTLLIIFFF